jgi:hypothetical protein
LSPIEKCFRNKEYYQRYIPVTTGEWQPTVRRVVLYSVPQSYEREFIRKSRNILQAVAVEGSRKSV